MTIVYKKYTAPIYISYIVTIWQTTLKNVGDEVARVESES